MIHPGIKRKESLPLGEEHRSTTRWPLLFSSDQGQGITDPETQGDTLAHVGQLGQLVESLLRTKARLRGEEIVRGRSTGATWRVSGGIRSDDLGEFVESVREA